MAQVGHKGAEKEPVLLKPGTRHTAREVTMPGLACLRVSYPLHNTHPIADPPKYGVLPIQMWREIQSDEELHIARVIRYEM